MKKLIILSVNYPYRPGDPFLEYEQKYFPKDMPIDAIPSGYQDNKRTMAENIPENVTFVPIAWRKMSFVRRLFYMLKALANRDVREDLRSLKAEKGLSFRSFAKSLSWTARGDWLFHLLEKHYRRELRENPEQLVFYSFWLLGSAYAGARLRKKYGCRCVSRAHNGDIYEERIDYGRLPMRKFTLENSDIILPCSDDGRKYLLDKYRVGDIRVSYLGSDDYGICRAALPEGDKPFVIASCAHMVPRKRLGYIVDALRLITGRKIEWVHFGDGPMREEIEKKSASLPGNISVRLMGRTAHDKIMKYYAENDIHLFISVSESEGIPVSIMEAVSFGIPVLATDACGTREIVKNSHGMLLPVDVSDRAIAEGIKRFMDMPLESYCDMRRCAREFWDDNFNAEKNYAEFYSLLQSL